MYIYLHLPFCSSICSYCDFPKVLYDSYFVSRYLEQLEKEVKMRYCHEKVCSIYIGGGTPTCLELPFLERLLSITHLFVKSEDIEFTIESNVESLTDEKIRLLKKYGVNRISLGVQSFNDSVLRELNRHHTKDMVFDVVDNIKRYGINNISIDYIYGVNSNIDIVKEDINTFLQLDIPHISCYSLIIEDGTIFKIKNKKNIDDEIEEEMYFGIEGLLEKHRYHHYEVSNYAKEGYQSIHNLNYWNNGDYYGFGLGAVSYINGYRRSNTKNLSKYLNGLYLDENVYEDISVKMSNELILGLRKIEGVSIQGFWKKYHLDLLTMYDIKSLLKDGLLEISNGNLRIPKEYFYLSNSILVHFL